VPVLVVVWGLLGARAAAQELETRFYTNAPVGMNVLQLGFVRSSGNILTDPALPVRGLDTTLYVTQLKYARVLDVFGKAGKVDVQLPLATGHWTGIEVGVGPRERDVTGLADARVAFNVNFVGSPALTVPEFRQFRQRTIVGAVVQVVAPTGTYDPTKLVNLGSNRWSFKSQIGVSRTVGRWNVEGAATLWMFTDNPDHYGGQRLAQDLIGEVQAHLVYSFRPGMWIGFDIGFLDGGTTTVDGRELNTLQSNSRAGVTLQIPFARRHGIRVAFSDGVSTRIGADFTSLVIGYQVMWGKGF